MGFTDTVAGFLGIETPHNVFVAQMKNLGRHFRLDYRFTGSGNVSCCAFTVYVRREKRLLLVTRINSTVRITAGCNVKFPLGRIPNALFGVLERLNQQLGHCGYDSMDNDYESFFCVRTSMPWNRLDAEVFMEVMSELVSRAAALDETLIEQGYA